jgi:hypothetical protein
MTPRRSRRARLRAFLARLRGEPVADLAYRVERLEAQLANLREDFDAAAQRLHLAGVLP